MACSVRGWVTPLGWGLALGLAPSVAHAGAPTIDPVFCPRGEITLRSDRLLATAKVNGKLRSLGNEFVVPVGAGIDPANEALTYYVEVDRTPVFKGELPAGALVANADGTSFVFKQRTSGGPVGKGSSIRLRQQGNLFRLKVRMVGADVSSLMGAPPAHLKQVLKIGDDCFSSILACTVRGAKLRCRPERSAKLRGRVQEPDGTPLAGTMLTAYDDSRLESITVFAQEDGRYAFPPLRPGDYRLRARRIGSEDGWLDPVTLIDRRTRRHDFTLSPTADTNAQLPSSLWFPLLLDKWPSPTSRGDFTLSCGNCHQIGSWHFRHHETAEEWNDILGTMLPRLPPFFQETRDHIYDALVETYAESAPPPPLLDLPPPPSGEILGAVIYEYGLGDPNTRPSCHDLELGLDGIVYADGGVHWIDPRTGARGTFPLNGGAHSIERDPNGNMWITQAGSDSLAFLNVTTGQFRYFPLPLIEGVQGSYPHTLRFDKQGRIWFSTTRSNHLTLFDPATEVFTYYPLPEADPAEVGLSIPTAYGCDTAPDGTVWYSQLHGQRIGHFTPGADTLEDFRPPFYGPRRLHVDAQGIVWVPGYGSGVLGRFDPDIERWKVYPLPTGRPGPEGFGYSETPYALNVNRNNAEVWITGSNSDTLIRFEPANQHFVAFPLPTSVSYTREIEFDPDNNVWTCTSRASPEEDVPGRGKFVKIELPPITAVCGDGRVGGREECDDGNGNDCDACSNRCTLVTGCGDGTRCGAEACDDGDEDDCDGCSASCVLEPGLLCGDEILNAACGEECDPPEAGFCTQSCTIPAVCGNGVPEDNEECDDGNSEDCDVCSNRCTLVTGCGDGTLCGGEACDDGNASVCDGCLPTCELETGHICGDGTLRTDCGEECDPPSDASPVCSYLCRNGPAGPLGTRHMSFGGSTYSSALGTAIGLGTLEGEFDLVGGAPGADGITTLSVTQPFLYRAAILGGAFGYMCFNISSCSGSIDCNGGTAVDVEVIGDSAGPGVQGNPLVTTTGLGADGGPGAVELSCEQAFFQIPGGQGDDCTIQTYPPETTIVYTTGQTEGRWLNADVRIGTGQISLSGENFVCQDWSREDGPGALAGTFLLEDDPQAGDTANSSVIDD